MVETGNITRASEKLHLAQTALGQQIRQLEDSLGVQLLVRHSRGISLTEPGQILHRHALSILQSVNDARREVIASGGNRQEVVSLGVTPSIQALIGPELLALAHEELPQITLRLVEDLSFNLLDALLRGELDFALASDVTTKQGLTSTALIEEDLLFVTGAASAIPPGPIRFQDAIATDLALVGDRDIVWRVVHGTAEKLSLPVNVAFKVASMPAIKILVGRGAATSIVPYGVVAEDIQQGLVVARPITQPAIKRTLFLSRLAGQSSFVYEPELMNFLDGIVERLADKMAPYGNLIGEGLGEG